MSHSHDDCCAHGHAAAPPVAKPPVAKPPVAKPGVAKPGVAKLGGKEVFALDHLGHAGANAGQRPWHWQSTEACVGAQRHEDGCHCVWQLGGGASSACQSQDVLGHRNALDNKRSKGTTNQRGERGGGAARARCARRAKVTCLLAR